MSRGQALPLVLGLWLLLAFGGAGVFALGRAHLATARAQTAADLAAASAARVLPGTAGAVPPSTTPPEVVDVASRVAESSGGRLVSATVPEWPPSAVDVVVEAPGPLGTTTRASARAALSYGAVAAGGPVTMARGGGYSGPLVYRDGKPMCPAVAGAFDLMDAAANAQGVDLVVNSGFRSDAEQAALFAAHPDPKWVAPPGRSRHRDATELDISTAGGAGEWLAANAGRFGFLQRYSWEPWHYGYLPGCGAGQVDPVPAFGDADGGGAVETTEPAAPALPAWVPAEYRALVLDAATANGLPPTLLAALLRAESGFDPRAVSPVGALGIAQFMPATAASVGLADPFDPTEAIPAAGRLLGDLVRRFGSVPLGLAAYNAGPGAVESHGGIPPYPETQAYVARIMTLAGDVSVGGGGVVLLRIGAYT